ncbi:thiamine pyrophosphate-dependent enzyme [Sinorhizobium meliloti]|uniref:thiamine pyrophosphate-dependent enzyme n=1 Tax=Rhizobium meliloti TaxID=382 RepID=UPI0013E3480E|nr:thiamine pyrophosphate-dependent enzyme [Sinorhizobium meliloti]
MQMVTNEGDQVITGYRDHGLWHAPERRHGRAHRTPRRTVEGQGGSMHMFSKKKHFYGGHGIVGAQVSLGTGIAFANRYRENGNVCLTPISARVPQTGAKSTRASTWPRCGNCPS